MPAADIVPFDYDRLDSPTVGALRGFSQRLRELAQKTAVGLWEMGRVLAEAHESLAACGTGTFQRWVEQETPLSIRTAYRLLNVHRAFDYATLAQSTFETTTLYLLAEPSTPPEARVEAIERAERGESIDRPTAETIIRSYRSPWPPRPPPEIREFERQVLRPQLHDAGHPNAPQVLEGEHEDLPPVPQEVRKGTRINLREQIVENLLACRDGMDPEPLAEEIINLLGQTSGSIALAAHFGIALAQNPLPLSDLTALAIRVSGKRQEGMERAEYLDWRKRVLRLIDALTYTGCGLYEHKLANGQLVYGIAPCGDA